MIPSCELLTEILNQYMNGQERFNTPTSILQNATDAPRPFSGASTRQSVRFENIPAWAKDNDDETDADYAPPNPAPTPSRPNTQNGQLPTLPTVHIVSVGGNSETKSVKDE